MTLGYLYVANKQKFINEAIVSAQSVKQFSNLPIALVTTEEVFTKELHASFDEVIIVNELTQYTYLSKIVGLMNSPFDVTVFLDSDTFVCSDISELFDLADFVDIATSQEAKKHTFIHPEMKYRNILPEFNSGVILYKKSTAIMKLFRDWLSICEKLKLSIDMPGLREAILLNFESIRFSIFPEEYNSHGYKTMIILNGEVKVIHERLGTKWNVLTPYFQSFDEMRKFADKINKKHYKRLYVPYLGIIPYYFSPFNIVYKLKLKAGIKRVSKNQ